MEKIEGSQIYKFILSTFVVEKNVDFVYYQQCKKPGFKQELGQEII